MKKIIAILSAVILITATFAGCSGSKEKSRIATEINDTVLLLGYTEEAAPFIENVKDGAAEGFIPELWDKIFDSVKGDFKAYRFERVEKGYELEKDGGFKGTDGKEYSASLLVGAVHKNDGTFNEDYSFTEPIITNRIIAVTKKDGGVASYSDFTGKKALTTTAEAKAAFEKHSRLYSACESVGEAKNRDAAMLALDRGTADVIITDEFTYMPLANKDNYTVLDGELDTIEYVIACAKYSGWKYSINEAIKELLSADYGEGDELTPLVERHFGYNASSFEYITEGDK